MHKDRESAIMDSERTKGPSLRNTKIVAGVVLTLITTACGQIDNPQQTTTPIEEPSPTGIRDTEPTPTPDLPTRIPDSLLGRTITREFNLGRRDTGGNVVYSPGDESIYRVLAQLFVVDSNGQLAGDVISPDRAEAIVFLEDDGITPIGIGNPPTYGAIELTGPTQEGDNFIPGTWFVATGSGVNDRLVLTPEENEELGIEKVLFSSEKSVDTIVSAQASEEFASKVLNPETNEWEYLPDETELARPLIDNALNAMFTRRLGNDGEIDPIVYYDGTPIPVKPSGAENDRYDVRGGQVVLVGNNGQITYSRVVDSETQVQTWVTPEPTPTPTLTTTPTETLSPTPTETLTPTDTPTPEIPKYASPQEALLASIPLTELPGLSTETHRISASQQVLSRLGVNGISVIDSMRGQLDTVETFIVDTVNSLNSQGDDNLDTISLAANQPQNQRRSSGNKITGTIESLTTHVVTSEELNLLKTTLERNYEGNDYMYFWDMREGNNPLLGILYFNENELVILSTAKSTLSLTDYDVIGYFYGRPFFILTTSIKTAEGVPGSTLASDEIFHLFGCLPDYSQCKDGLSSFSVN